VPCSRGCENHDKNPSPTIDPLLVFHPSVLFTSSNPIDYFIFCGHSFVHAMSKQSQPQGSPSAKSLRSRMGGIMRRSSTAIGGFTRPGTPSRSSTESLRLEANASGPEHVMPSPVAESPAREAAESLPEPVGPSKLSGSVTSPTPAPESLSTVPPSRPEQPLDVSSKEVSAPLVQPTPEPAPAAAAEVAPAPRSDAAPVSLPEASSTAPPGKLPEAVPVKSVDPAAYVTRSPESLSRAASEHAADEALPVRRSEDSGSTRSHGQVLPSQERQLPTEVYAAPWDSGPLVAERSSQPEQATLAAPNPMSLRPNPASIDRVSTPPMTVETLPIKDSVSSVGTSSTIERLTCFPPGIHGQIFGGRFCVEETGFHRIFSVPAAHPPHPQRPNFQEAECIFLGVVSCGVVQLSYPTYLCRTSSGRCCCTLGQ
jgi:hypothetical protein